MEHRLIAYLVGQDVAIMNSDEVCVASSDPAKIGRIIRLNHTEKYDRTTISARNQKIELLYKAEKYNRGEFGFIKKMAKVVLSQYLDTLLLPSDSIDQLVTEIIEQPLNAERITFFENKAQSFGLNLEIRRAAILVSIDDFVEDNLSHNLELSETNEDIIKRWKRKILSSVSDFFTQKTDIMITYLGDGNFVLFKEIVDDEKKFVRNMRGAYKSIFGPIIASSQDKLTVAYSDPHSGIAGLYEAYHEAAQARQFGKKTVGYPVKNFYYGDLGALRILVENDEGKRKRLANDVLRPLEKKTLRLTLETYFEENMDINKTAHKLHVHPNTVSYRINKIADSLDLDPRIFKQAFELRIALLMDDIFK